jgi:TonB family protein
MLMSGNTDRAACFNNPQIEEKYGWAFIGSMVIHGLILLMVLFGGYLLPRTAVTLGTGLGGGTGGESYTVGMVDELSGGVGMEKPSIVLKPPALVKIKPEADKSKAIPLPESNEQKKRNLAEKEMKQAAKASQESNIIPTEPEAGSGGSGGHSGGSGGGFGGGSGISIGLGSGGIGNTTYARTVEDRISSNWIRPSGGARVEIIYSFYIARNGTIDGIKLDKSSGNSQLDWMAKSAIVNAASPNPLPPPPQEFRGRLIKFVAQFIYPPNQ